MSIPRAGAFSGRTGGAPGPRSSQKGFLASDKYFLDGKDAQGSRGGHPEVLMAVEINGRVREMVISDPLLTEDGLPRHLVR